ncbi:MAG: hypothetical protein RLZ98_1324 [Pseudomonadota bacterium]|jgi:pyruvate dehydrogenase E1 component alpha subunit
MRNDPANRDRLALFDKMVRMRRFEEAVIRVAQENPYVGRQHLHIGHEATGAAVAQAMQSGDRIASTHRNHGYLIACGGDPSRALAEILGRADGFSGGKAGSWHLCDAAAGFLSTSAMVGGSVALAVGAAFGLKRRGAGNIAFAHFGDGTLDEGICYETMNLASVYELPVVFVCENNSKAGQRPSSMLAAKSLRHIPDALQIPTMIVDGADADRAARVFAEAAGQVRATSRPVFVESTLERWPGSHQIEPVFTTGVTDLSHAYDETLVSGKHAEWVKRNDPVLRYARRLVEEGAASKAELAELDGAASREMEAARTFAIASPYPDTTSAFAGTFA